MSGKINFSCDGNNYTLEYTRKSVKLMEAKGFSIDSIDTKPVTAIPDLFAGAFLAHHKFLKRNVIDEIFDRIENKSELISELVGMYSDTILSLMSDDEESEKNIQWEKS